MLKITDIVVVRKYTSNRKLYLPTEGRYTNSKELMELYKAGYDIEVVDHNSGKDITLSELSTVMNSLGEYTMLQQFLNEMLIVGADQLNLKVV
jgi:polyhydroxyalkanoate synthesis regulator protein